MNALGREHLASIKGVLGWGDPVGKRKRAAIVAPWQVAEASRRSRERRRANPAAYAATRRNYRKKNRLRLRLRKRIREVLLGVAKKSDNTRALIGCSSGALRQHLESLFKPGMTWENYGFRGWHVDHVRPCASFDLTDPEQQRACFNFKNLQPLWARDNLTKHAKWTPAV